MISREPQYVQYLFAKAIKNGVPLSGTFELTARCNFNCKMCYIHNSDNNELKKDELTTQQWKRIADEAQKAGMLFLLLTGGEPLLREDFAEIYSYCKNLGFEISVNTNGSLITDEIVNLFSNQRPARVNITLYGSNDETYYNVTCRKGNFEKVTQNILRLKAAGVQVKISITISKYNNNDLEGIYKFARDNKIPTETTAYLFPSARLDQPTDRPSAVEAARNMILNDKCYYGDRFNSRKDLFEKFGKSEKEKRNTGLPVRCRAGRAAFWVSYDGTLLPCGMMTRPSVSLVENSFADAWEIIKKETAKIVLPAECTDCEYSDVCESCAAACFAETGEFDVVPKYLCEKAREYVRLSKKELGL